MSGETYFKRKALLDKLTQVDAVAERHGFVSRERIVRETLGPVEMLTARAPVRVSQRFKRFCRDNRYAYWEGIEELMNRGGVE